jgi:hypothetical protein
MAHVINKGSYRHGHPQENRERVAEQAKGNRSKLSTQLGKGEAEFLATLHDNHSKAEAVKAVEVKSKPKGKSKAKKSVKK